MEQSSYDQITKVAQASGLKHNTVADLFDSGWSYTETGGKPPTWKRIPTSHVYAVLNDPREKRERSVLRPTASKGVSHCGPDPIIEIEFEDYNDASTVRDRMRQLISQYGHATLGDLWTLIDRPSVYSDEIVGWYTADDFRIKMNHPRTGWVLNFPPVREI